MFNSILKTRKKNHIWHAFIFISISLLSFSNCSNPKLASYNYKNKNITITRTDLIEYLKEHMTMTEQIPVKNLKLVLKEMALSQVVFDVAQEQKITATDEFTLIKKYGDIEALRFCGLTHFKETVDSVKKFPFFIMKEILFNFPPYDKIKNSADAKAIYNATQKNAFDVYEKIKNNELSFIDAYNKYPNNKQHETHMSLYDLEDPGYQWAVHALLLRQNHKIYSVDKDKVPVYVDGKVVSHYVNKNRIVIETQSLDKSKIGKGFIGVEIAPFMYGQVKITDLNYFGELKDVSFPVWRLSGYVIISLTDIKNFTQKYFYEYVRKAYPKQTKDMVKKVSDYRWNSIMQKALMEQIRDYENKYLFGMGAILPNDWRTKEILFMADDLKITRSEFMDFIKSVEVINMSRLPLENYEIVNGNLMILVKQLIWAKYAEKHNLFNIEKFKKYIAAKHKMVVYQYYKLKHWAKVDPATDAEILAEYKKVAAEFKKKNKKDYYTYAIAKEKIARDLLKNKVELNYKFKEAKILEQVSFKLYEKNFK